MRDPFSCRPEFYVGNRRLCPLFGIFCGNSRAPFETNHKRLALKEEGDDFFEKSICLFSEILLPGSPPAPAAISASLFKVTLVGGVAIGAGYLRFAESAEDYSRLLDTQSIELTRCWGKDLRDLRWKLFREPGE